MQHPVFYTSVFFRISFVSQWDKAFPAAIAHGGISSAPSPPCLPHWQGKCSIKIYMELDCKGLLSSPHVMFPTFGFWSWTAKWKGSEGVSPCHLRASAGIPSTAPLAGKAVIQTTFQSKILGKSFITRSVPVRTSYTTHNFQLLTSFPQRLHIQMADLVILSFLTFFFLFSAFPPHHFWRPLPSQKLPCESEEAMSLLNTDVKTQIFFRFQIIQILRMLSLAPENIWIWWNSHRAVIIKCTLRHKELAN